MKQQPFFTDAYPTDAHSKRYELLEHSQMEGNPIKHTDASSYYWKDSQRVKDKSQVQIIISFNCQNY